jgi:hypothetical protein
VEEDTLQLALLASAHEAELAGLCVRGDDAAGRLGVALRGFVDADEVRVQRRGDERAHDAPERGALERLRLGEVGEPAVHQSV